MAITYQTEGIKMPDIKKRETTEWIKAVAATYEKRIGEIAGRKNIGNEPPISSTRLLYRYHHF